MVAADLDRLRARRGRAALLEQRLVVNATGPQTLRFLPPLIVDEGDVDEAVARLAPLLA